MILKTLIYSRRIGEVLDYLKSHRDFIEEIEQFIFKAKRQRLYVRFEILKFIAEAILIKDGRGTAENYVKEAIERYGMTPRICTVCVFLRKIFLVFFKINFYHLVLFKSDLYGQEFSTVRESCS